MKEYLVELYVSCAERDGVGRRAKRAQRAALELTAAGTPVRFVRSIFVPTDETCLLLFEAPSIDAVREAAHRAELPFDHVAETAVDTSTTDVTTT
jgi:Nickel responsive protein SCO4226-like